jgi:hypothetical protein
MIRRGGFTVWKLSFDQPLNTLAGSMHDESHVYVGGKEKIMEIDLHKKAIVREVCIDSMTF